MGADKSAENTPKAQKKFWPKTKSLGVSSSLWVSVVRNYYVCIGWYSSAAESTDTMKSKHYLEFEFKVMRSKWTLNKTKSIAKQTVIILGQYLTKLASSGVVGRVWVFMKFQG